MHIGNVGRVQSRLWGSRNNRLRMEKNKKIVDFLNMVSLKKGLSSWSFSIICVWFTKVYKNFAFKKKERTKEQLKPCQHGFLNLITKTLQDGKKEQKEGSIA